jgi:hypothetical protein
MATDNHIVEHALLAKASARANGDPFPGPLAEAFCKGSIKVGEYTVRKIAASDWTILRQLKSPLITLIQDIHQEPGTVPEVPISKEQEWELAFQFTHPVKDTRDLLELGEDHFKEAVLAFIDSGVDEIVVSLICRAVIEQIKRSWETALKHKADLEEKEGISFLAEPPVKKTG